MSSVPFNWGEAMPHPTARTFEFAIQAQRAAQCVMQRNARLEEAELKRMLSLWVSELNPVILRNHRTGQLVGLGIEGQVFGPVAIIIPAWTDAPSCKRCGRMEHEVVVCMDC